MDPLSWLLIGWIGVCGIVYFIVQTILPIFIPPIKRELEKPIKIQEIQSHEDLPVQSSISCWATTAMGVVKGIGQKNQGESCEWVNTLLIWLNRNVRRSPQFINAWLRSMNEASNKLAMSLGCDVYFEEVNVSLDQSDRNDEDAPKLESIRSELGPKEHMTIHTHLTYPKLHLRLVASQKLPDRLIVSNYVATLRDLKGQANVRMASVENELFLMISFEGQPQVVVNLENSDKNAVERVDPNLVEEIIKRCLITAITNICLGKPQQINGHVTGVGVRNVMSPEEVRLNQVTTMQERARSRRLLLKVQRAEKLGGGDFPSQPYVMIEMDEPAQKHETTLSLNSHPIWEEEFLFDLNERSEEILFEVYDRTTDFYGKILEPRFLGLAIVGVEELRQSHTSSHTLALQSRPYKNDSVSGTLQVQFMFLRDANRSMDDSHMVKSVSQYVDGQKEDKGKKSDDVIGKSPSTVDRCRKTERSFFADLKKKLSFRKKRAQSLDNQGDKPDQIQQPRSVSTPASRDVSATRRPEHTPMTSDSEMSATSNDSVFAQSQLVVEVVDNGLQKYYLIPTAVQRHAIGKKIIKSGRKLHVFNAHTFTATKLTPATSCAVCKRIIKTGFRRKGYQCRDCGFICHKRCHFKTESHCPCDRISNLPLEIVKLS